MSEESAPAWSGFWRRVGAFVVDTLLLGVVGYCVGMLFHDALASVAGPTRLIGLVVATLYFGVLSSRLGGSRTVGMRLLGLKVMSTGGRPLGLAVSLWRALVLVTPMMLNGMMVYIANEIAMTVLGVAFIVLVFGLGLAQIVLLLFNLPSRRLAHDLVSGAAVVRVSATETPAGVSRIAVGAAVGAILLALGAGVWAVAAGRSFAPQWIAELEPPRAAVAALPGVLEAGVRDSTTTFYGTDGQQTTRTLIVTAKVRALPKDPGPLVRQVGDAVAGAYRLRPGQKVRVNLTSGFDIGIASGWRSYAADYAPAVAAPAPVTPTKPAP
ncbi:RDD family protein [Caulobacter mirabilis]|uniref:RDD domain-containing protein n=1 Tax=Caulobacter mirabilis TaxID=69666 RepID=A0A2D2B0Q1_9CAUL|nr:RDD family protein [Caulobacter mirabilis]ATQ43835.1 hypothetical protein CSW64_16245 [Caulobacter mirabilis]